MYRLIIVKENINGRPALISALYDDSGHPVEFLPEYVDEMSMLGNIYVGRVENIVANLDAAFVRIADDVRCYLPLQELMHPIYVKRQSEKKRLCIGDELLVQVTKEAQKTKEASVTTNLSLTGKYVVLTTGNFAKSVSKKLPKEVREHYVKLLTDPTFFSAAACDHSASVNNISRNKNDIAITQDNIVITQNQISTEQSGDIVAKNKISIATTDFGIVIRTNAQTVEDSVVLEELNRLSDQLKQITEAAKTSVRPKILYAEPPSYIRYLRGLRENELEKVMTDDREIFCELVRSYPMPEDVLAPIGKREAPVTSVSAPNGIQICHYTDPQLALSSLYPVKRHMEEALQKKVWLKSGGYLVIEPTEALTVIDVNTGKSLDKKNMRENILRVNREAIQEIARQIRLRNLSGIILADLINMDDRTDEEELLAHLRSVLKQDPVPTQLVDMTKLGLVEITRKKVRKSLYDFFRQSLS